jgi:uncharacterized protein YbaP (TraB family)
MHRSMIAGCVLILAWGPVLSGGSDSGGSDAPATGAAEVTEEVVVTGEQPGPQLWRATRDGHVLWILGTVTEKPADITWRPKQVAAVLDETQLVINQQLQGTTWPANIEIELDTISPFNKLSMGRQLLKMRQQHAPPPLREVVPVPLYERFAALKRRYLPGRADIEMQRPRVAASMLYSAAIAANGLTTRAMIHETVHRLARKRRVKVSEITLEIEVDPETLLAMNREFNEVPLAAELACLEDTIAQIETDLPAVRARANAWAIGDVNAMRQLPFLTRKSCDAVRYSAPRWSDLRSRLENHWLDNVDAAVTKNSATLALLDMSELLQPKGLLAALISRGYTVEGP